ncbi:MAG: siphovirus Gp157 family protein [Steroidobacteraceae bacterium]
MSLPSLYTLTGQFRELTHLIGTDEELDEHALEAIRTTLDMLQGDIDLKATNVGAYVLNLEAYAKAAREASKQLAERARRIERRADALREYVRVQLEALGITKIESAQFTVAIRKNPPAVQIDLGADLELPERFLQAPPPPPVRAPDKKAIAAALKAGELVAGCTLTQSTRLEIRA